ncbi:MAG: phage holin family protein [Parcubacteria group bacterium]|nr:phage holin family protein [Parcubacteria group bacterium]
MRFIARIIFYAFVNTVAFLALPYFLPGFQISGNFRDVIIAAALLTLVNIFIRPLLKLLLGPFIILSFGLLIIGINAALLYAVDIYSEGISINGLGTLLVATIFISAVHIIVNFAGKSLFEKA